jgi:hypothetical protein
LGDLSARLHHGVDAHTFEEGLGDGCLSHLASNASSCLTADTQCRGQTLGNACASVRSQTFQRALDQADTACGCRRFLFGTALADQLVVGFLRRRRAEQGSGCASGGGFAHTGDECQRSSSSHRGKATSAHGERLAQEATITHVRGVLVRAGFGTLSHRLASFG